MVSRVIPVDRFDLVIFGATGDLARRKILPALFHRRQSGQMPQSARVIGTSRSELDASAFRALARDAIREADPGANDADLDAFLAELDYVAVDVTDASGWAELGTKLRDGVTRAFYLSVAPRFFAVIAGALREHGLADDGSRIVVEKPFGHDRQTARALNAALARCFSEQQIYRIDHYLGKETVQNLMAVRFANVLFEPLWNAQYVDHVQITVAESVGIEGRGDYYDNSGAARDMLQNHLMQLLCLTAMEPPSHFDPDAVRDEKLKVIRALDTVAPADVVRGQYRAKDDVAGYLADAGRKASATETFIALKVGISNWRWAGTPFYLRTGKRLRARHSEIAVIFKDPPHFIFDPQEGRRGNVLVIRLQPNEGMDLRVTIKEPGPGGMRLIEVPLDMSFAEALGPEGAAMPDAYERLIMDVIRGNQTLFMRGDEVEAAWAWVDPMIAAWEGKGEKPVGYEPDGSGPEDALMLLHRAGRRWRAIGKPG